MHEIKPIIKRILVIGILIVACFILQTSVFSNFQLAGLTPNIMLIITAFFGFMRGQKDGLLVGFISGLLLDLFFDSYFGIFALIYMLIGYLNGFFRRLLFGDDIKLPMLLVFISDILYGILNFLLLFLPRGRSSFLFYFMNIIMPEAIYTVIISFFLYFIVYHLNNWLDKDDNRRGDIHFA